MFSAVICSVTIGGGMVLCFTDILARPCPGKHIRDYIAETGQENEIDVETLDGSGC